MIRAFQKSDIEAVMRIWLEGNLQAHPFIPEKYWKENEPMVRNQIAQAEVCVYEKDGEIQGFVGAMGDYIAGIFVDQRYRSAGIGRRLLESMKEQHPVLSLGVYKKNKRAVRFYLREGFQVAEERLEENAGEMEYVMQWKKENAERISGSAAEQILHSSS